MTARWTTPDEIAARVRRRWDDGSLLRAYAAGPDFAEIDLPLRGPRVSEIGDDLAAVRDWVARLDAGRRSDRCYALRWKSIGGRQVGRNEVPDRALVTTFDQAWRLLGVGEAVRRFDDVLALAASQPAMRDWVVAHPLRAVDLHADLPRLLAAYVWLDEHRHSGRYLREITAPGVDTKFAERHRGVLAAALGVPAGSAAFLTALGLGAKPELVRFRPGVGLKVPLPATELAMRADELASLAIAPTSALVVENEITYLSVAVPEDGVVIWGKGFEVDRVGRLPWLGTAEVRYWGDLDTHGFAILDRLRAWLPHTRSVLMDEATLLAHRERWGSEERPTRATLTRLDAAERDLYQSLVTDALGERVRLEQERIDWAWARERLGG